MKNILLFVSDWGWVTAKRLGVSLANESKKVGKD